MSDITNAPLLTKPPKSDPLEVEKMLRGVTDAVESIPEKMESPVREKEDKSTRFQSEQRENKRFQELGEKIGQTVSQSSQNTLQSVVPAMLGPLNLAFEPLKEIAGFNITDSLVKGLSGLGSKAGGLFGGKKEKEEQQKEVGAYGSGIEYDDKLDRKTVQAIDPGSVYLSESLQEDSEERAGFFDNLLSKLGLGGVAGLGALAMKAAGIGLIAVGMVQGITDAIWGWGQAEDWGVDGWIGALAGFLSGEDDGWQGALGGMSKFGAIGAGIGLIAGGPVGMIIGGLLGAAVGGVLGYLNTEDLAVNIQGIWDTVKSTEWAASLVGGGAGALIGLALGGPVGAVLGGLLGAAIGAGLQGIIADGEELNFDNVWEVLSQSGWVMGAMGGFIGGGLGFAIGSLFGLGPVGLIVGALLGMAIGGVAAWFNRQKAQGTENIEKMSEDLQEYEKQGFLMEDLTQTLSQINAGTLPADQMEALSEFRGETPLAIMQVAEKRNAFVEAMKEAGIEGSLGRMTEEEKAFHAGFLGGKDGITEQQDYFYYLSQGESPLEAAQMATGDTSIDLRSFEADATVEDAIITNEGQIIRTSPDDNIFATKNDLTIQEDITAINDSNNLAIIDDEKTHSLLQELISLLQDKEMGNTAVINNRVSRFSPESVYQQLSAR